MTGFAVKPSPRAIVAFYGYGDIDGPWYSRPDPFYLQRPTVARDAALQSVGNTAVAEPPIPNQRGRFYLYCRQSGRWPIEVTGHDPDKEPRAFDRFCPVRNVSREYPPTLLLHGDSDTDVPHAQSVQMAKELERAGVEHQLITIPGGPHGFDGQASDPVVARAFDRAVEFLQKHVAGAR